MKNKGVVFTGILALVSAASYGFVVGSIVSKKEERRKIAATCAKFGFFSVGDSVFVCGEWESK